MAKEFFFFLGNVQGVQMRQYVRFPQKGRKEHTISKISSGNSVNGLIFCPFVAIGYTNYTVKCFNLSKEAERIVDIMNLPVI